jgi:UDP-N-acetyl-alpha-D-muramoyl-L-alanyl-L-glutamate epimerase
VALVETVSLLDIAHSKHQIRASFAADRMRFTTAYWYDSVDFDHLRAVYGPRAIDLILFHIAAFEINKICSLRPRTLDWGRFANFVDEQFAALWKTVFQNVWAQWRFENDAPDYGGPNFAVNDGRMSEPAVRLERDSSCGPEVLSFFGGGKDSLVAAKILEKAVGEYDTLAYSSSLYGSAAQQHGLIAGLLGFCTPSRHRQQWIFDDFSESPVLTLGDQITSRTLTAAETPSSIFAALPYVLQHKYSHIALAHEKSADTGQFVWKKTGEDVNHQWGKSYAAEVLLNRYLSSRLVHGLTYFSVLKPIYDVVIFSMLRSHLDAVPYTHSCNIAKPWCRRCPKCVYVWLNYLAYLPTDIVQRMFGENLFEVEENVGIFRQLLGLEDHMPFECIGQMDEVKLAFEICRRKRLSGRAMDLFVSRVPKPDYPHLIDRYTKVDLQQSAVPEGFKGAIAQELSRGAQDARRCLQESFR